MDRFGQNVGHLKRRDDEYVGGQKSAGDAVAGKKKTGKTKDHVI